MLVGVLTGGADVVASGGFDAGVEEAAGQSGSAAEYIDGDYGISLRFSSMIATHNGLVSERYKICK